MKKFVLLGILGIGLMFSGCASSEIEVHSESITLIGTWTANSVVIDGRTVQEQLTFTSDGTYSVEARYEDTKEIVANESGTFMFSSNTIKFTTDPSKIITETYTIDSETRTLTITSEDAPPKVWTRK